MAISLSQGYIASNPRFRLIRRAEEYGKTVKPQPVQRTILYALFCRDAEWPLDFLAAECEKGGYRSTFKSERDIRKSILHHLKLWEKAGIIREC